MTCILCGARQVMLSYICTGCQDKIQREVMGSRTEMVREARDTLRKYGINPDKDQDKE